MCGIAGILNNDPRVAVDAARLLRMSDILAHRGPDGRGHMIDGPVGFAHTRLAIIDVACGKQPMRNEDGSIRIVYNGEIYNHETLRRGLQARGHTFRTRSDTESILHLYEEVGDQVVDQLRGMFAFAIWDRRRGRLLLARDRLGIKPLYYAVTDTGLVFASEIKALLASGLVRAAFDERVLPEYLAMRFVAGDRTFFRGVRKLLPGTVLTWSMCDGVQTKRYWHLPPPADEPAMDERHAAAQTRALLETAVKSHLMSDVPLGVFLSGGIDSTVLTALVARATTSRVKTFSVGFHEHDANELPYARLAADRLGTEHRDVTVTAGSFVAALPKLVWHEDEPIAFPSSVPLHFVSRLASDHVKVVLTGEGADELFLGYNRYRVTRWNARLGHAYWTAIPRPIRRQVRAAVRALPQGPGRIARRTFLALEPDIRDLYFENFAVFPMSAQRQVLRRDLIDADDPYTVELRCFNEAPGGLLDRLCRVDLQTYLLELLMKQDQMSMAASIESRVPFLDDRLVEHLVSVPGHIKMRGRQSKAILRAAVEDLVPPEIMNRPKMGFPVPIDHWFGGELGSFVDEFVLGSRATARGYFDRATLQQMVNEHRSGRARHGDRLWLLVNLEIWLRTFIDGEHSADVVSGAPSSHATAVDQNGRALARHVGRADS
jgi:asparagine synthase (glutamine-hydrolysing)